MEDESRIKETKQNHQIQCVSLSWIMVLPHPPKESHEDLLEDKWGDLTSD